MSTLHQNVEASYARRAVAGGGSPTLADQHAALSSLAENHGFVIPEEYRFGDIGSGADVDRPSLSGLMAHARESAAFSRLYIMDYSRLLRPASPADLDRLLLRLNALGLELSIADAQEVEASR